ncbi:lamin tail domain-containing protein [candidate division WOR-3 bacterium]|nr:lamin tail domain-containing protein [candidate division WOR-3 bacterium]
MYFLFLLFSAVCINEVMSNPLGSGGVGSPEDRNEFVEIFNIGPDAVDLGGWQITDLDAVDEIIPFYELLQDSNTILLPGEFALVMDPEYSDSGENYMPYGIPTCVLLTVDNTTIGNELSTTDPIALISPEGDTVSTYYNTLNPGDGISVERVYPYNGDVPENWRSCEDISGSTPGRENSVYASPDFVLDSLWVNGNTVFILLFNPHETELSGTVEVFNDENRNGILDEGELIDSFVLAGVSEDSLCQINFSLSSEGFYVLGFDLIEGTIFRRVRIGEGISDIIINEIMFAPAGHPEWVELFNRSAYDVSLDFFLLDSESAGGIEVLPGGYVLISSDSVAFLGYYGVITASILQMDLSFSNNGDSVFLFDENGFILDKVVYSGDQTDGNYSLERINPDISSDNSTNWGQSVSEGGTPGAVNSVFAEYKRTDVALAVTPRHFTPDGDGEDEMSVISFNLPYLRNEVTLQIYDRRGHLLLENTQVYGGERGEWIWDGKDRRGETVSTGLYVVFLLIEDADGGKRSSEKAVVSVGR